MLAVPCRIRVEPQQRPGGHRQLLLEVDRPRLAWAQTGLRLASPHLGGEGVPQSVVGESIGERGERLVRVRTVGTAETAEAAEGQPVGEC